MKYLKIPSNRWKNMGAEIMKRSMILFVGICVLFSSIPAMADQAADEAAVRKVVERLLPP